MAKVTINTNFKDSFIFQVKAFTTSSRNLAINSSVIQDYRVTINDGTPFTIINNTSNASIPIQANAINDILTVEIESINGGSLANVVSLSLNGFQFAISMSTTELSKFPNLETLSLTNHIETNLYGNITDLPATLTYLQAAGNLVGNISDLPSLLQQFRFYNSSFASANNITGTFADLPDTLTNLLVYDNNDAVKLSGNTVDLPPNLLEIQGLFNSTITFDVDNLPNNLQIVVINSGDNMTITGDIANLPASMDNFNVSNYNSVNLTGNIANLPSNIRYFYIFPKAGDVNTISGNIEDVPSSLINLTIGGNNTIAGDIGSLVLNNSDDNRYSIKGNNTISGLIQNISGRISSLNIEGNNTISGDIGLVLAKEIEGSIDIKGNNTISAFTAPVSTQINLTSFFRLTLEGDNDLTTAEVDALIQYLDSIFVVFANRSLEILGNSQPRSSASDAAYNSLLSKGFNFNLNT